jgi:hypothetical protein
LTSSFIAKTLEMSAQEKVEYFIFIENITHIYILIMEFVEFVLVFLLFFNKSSNNLGYFVSHNDKIPNKKNFRDMIFSHYMVD